MCSSPESLPLSRPVLDLAGEAGEMGEEVVHLAEVGVRARWHVEEPACEVDRAEFICCKVRGDCVVVADRAGQAEAHDLGLEPRHEPACDTRVI